MNAGPGEENDTIRHKEIEKKVHTREDYMKI